MFCCSAKKSKKLQGRSISKNQFPKKKNMCEDIDFTNEKCMKEISHQRLPTSEYLTVSNKKYSKSQQHIPGLIPLSYITDTVFVAGKGWIFKSEIQIPDPPKEQNNQINNDEPSNSSEKEDALNMIQGLAVIEKNKNPVLEKKMKETEIMLKKHDELAYYKRKPEVVVSTKNILLVGDLTPPLEL